MKNNKKNNLKEIMATMTEAFMRKFDKIFPFVLPLITFLFAIVLALRIYYMPGWHTKLFFTLMSAFLILLGIVLLIKRKKIWS